MATCLRLAGKRILVTHADRFMGAPVAARFKQEGAEVIEDFSTPRSAAAGSALVEAAGELDVIFANFASPPAPQLVDRVSDAEWSEMWFIR